MPKISVIIPVFNAALHLRECLDSVVNQTLHDIEIICIDDGSKDESLTILKEYANFYSNIKLICNPVNLGQSAARNKGMDIASGEYIAFLDADDYLNLNMYQVMYEQAEKNSFPGVVSSSIRFVKNDTFKEDTHIKPSERSYIEDYVSNPDGLIWQSPSVCNKIFARKLISYLRFLNDTMFEDIAFSTCALMSSGKNLSINGLNYFYRRDLSKGVSSKAYKPNSKIADIFKVTDFIEQYAKENNLFELYENQIRIIQVASILQRISEIESWDMDQSEKNRIIREMYNNIKSKYQDPKTLDNGLLSGKADIGIISRLS